MTYPLFDDAKSEADMGRLEGEVCFITGGASGIGLAMAQSLATQGMRIAIADKDENALAKATFSLRARGAVVLPLVLDVRDADAWTDAVDTTETQLGPIFLLCNNAGVGLAPSPAEDIAPADWNRIIDINLGGVFLGVRALAGRMKRRGQGHIVNTSSILGLFPRADTAAYVASKFAVVGFSEALRAELAPYGVGVTILMPGLVRTEQSANARASQKAASPTDRARPKPRGMGPDAIGALVVEAILRNRLYAISHAEYLPVVENRLQRLLDAFHSASARGESEDIFYLGGDSLSLA